MCTTCQGVPPDPVSNLQITTPTATIMELTWEVSDRFNVTYNYTVNGCLETGGPFSVNISDGSIRSHTLDDLNEDSSYTITVGAINTAGSKMATTTADTLISGETLCNSSRAVTSSLKTVRPYSVVITAIPTLTYSPV